MAIRHTSPSPSLLFRVLQGLRALPDRPAASPAAPPVEECRTPLVRLIDAQKAPTVELPVITAGVRGS